MRRAATILLTMWLLPLAMLAGRVVAATSQQDSLAEQWRTFQGSWSAIGQRRTLPTESGRVAAVVQLSGAVLLTDGTGSRIGFQGEAIGFDDGGSLSSGRAVWTDARGNQVFSAFHGDPFQTGRHIVGTITGGTGRYAGVTGGYALTWQYVVSGEDEVVQGRTVDLTGRLRLTERQR